LFYKSKNKNPLKSSGKLVVNFSKMDILKMSNFEKLEENVCKKFTLLGDALNTKNFIQNLLA
jgi:hypothetical protein